MYISKKRIVNPRRYLFALHPGDQFYVTAPLAGDDLLQLKRYGIKPGEPARIPVPTRSATWINADGKWLLLRDLPKELRQFVRAYHLVDWNGDDHYGTCIQERWCYQRKLIPPAEMAFVIEDGLLFSPLLTNSEENMECIKLTMNVVLEMIGHCEIWTAEKAPAFPPVQQVEVPWEILRAGTRDRDEWEEYLVKTVERKSKAQQVEICNRHEHLMEMKPEFCVLGAQNFFGYVIYGFPALDLFLFESNEINNATYVFRGDWEKASRLTKMEVLSGGLQEARIYHTGQWKEHLGRLFYRISGEVA